MGKINLIYLMGAGRSGTTAIATFLGGHPQIQSLGEMHQFYDHLRDDLPCSCGKKLNDCQYWSKILSNLPDFIIKNPAELQKLSDELEYHSSVPYHMMKKIRKHELENYNFYQGKIMDAISQESETRYFLDSAKYIGRNLSLRKNKNLSVKTIYIVRDVRGVVNSFSKQVQTTRSPLNTIFYYLTVNLTAFINSFNSSVLNLRYEDFMSEPEKTLKKIETFLGLDMTPVLAKIQNQEQFEIGHIIGGNRLKKEKNITFKEDQSWQRKLPWWQKILYYFLASPVMLLNRYKI